LRSTADYQQPEAFIVLEYNFKGNQIKHLSKKSKGSSFFSGKVVWLDKAGGVFAGFFRSWYPVTRRPDGCLSTWAISDLTAPIDDYGGNVEE
jgi:hypothetical protein